MTSAPRTSAPWGAIQRVRLQSLFLASLFCVSIALLYINFLAPTYYYLGFPLTEGNRDVAWLAAVIVVVSAMFMPLRIERFTGYFLWMIFYIVYAPSMLIIPLQGSLPDDGLALVCALGVSFGCMQVLGRCEFRIKQLVIGRAGFVVAFFLLYAVLLAYVLFHFSGHLDLATFSTVYAQRSVASDVISGTFVGYATGILSGALNPFLMAVGIVEKRRLWYLLGVVGQVFMYATFALKSVLLSIVFISVIGWFLITKRPFNSGRLGFAVVGIFVATAAIIPLLNSSGEGIAWQLVSLMFMRTFGMTGTLTGDYANFFSGHPLTYYSHLNVVAQFVHYPYDQSIGEEVGYWLVGGPLDANANFWATDGIAAAGIPGVLIIGLIVGGFLVVVNSLLRQKRDRVALLAFVPFIVQVSNTSFFTTLLTGGGAVLLILVYCWQQSRTNVFRSNGLSGAAISR